MEKILNVKANNVPVYDIVFEKDYDKLAELMEKLDQVKRKVCIVTDSNVGPLFLEEVAKKLELAADRVVSYVIPAGEETKNLETVQKIYEFLISQRFDRNDLLAALGGGVTGDLTGYVAATYLRGIRFIQMPTSLLAMVDSSVGGKTGVDFLNYKNMVGAFHQPKAVYINLSVLEELPEEHFYNGFAEVIKYGLIQDCDFYHWLLEHVESIACHNMDELMQVAYKSCLYKREIVERDPNEKGERALLNFGHTLGHSIEKASSFGLLHGQCVSIGMTAAAFISMRRGYLCVQDVKELEKVLKLYHLPIRTSGFRGEEIIGATKNDKKMEAGKIKFILLKEIGHAYIDNTVSDEEMKEALQYVMGEIEI